MIAAGFNTTADVLSVSFPICLNFDEKLIQVKVRVYSTLCASRGKVKALRRT
jgi:hypothetical protein